VKATVTIASSAALVAWAVVGLQAGPGETEPPIQAGYAVMAAVFALGQMWRWAALAIAISVIMVPIFLVAQISCCMK